MDNSVSPSKNIKYSLNSKIDYGNPVIEKVILIQKPASEKKLLSELHSQSNFDWIKNAVLFPYYKGLDSLLLFPDMLKFKISHVVKYKSKNYPGNRYDVPEHIMNNGIWIYDDIDDCLDQVDTIILGDVSEISYLENRNYLEYILEIALSRKKHVYSLNHIPNRYSKILSHFQKQGLKVNDSSSPMSDLEAIKKQFNLDIPSQTPVVAVTGTSPNQGKFNTQLLIVQEFEKLGYKVGRFGYEPQASLLGFDYTFPVNLNSNENNKIPMENVLTHIQSVMVGIEANEPDIIIAGVPSGFISFNAEKKTEQSVLQSFAYIFGVQPDAIVLVVNCFDNFVFIKKHINVLENIGKGKVILLVLSEQHQEVVSHCGMSSVSMRVLPHEEIQSYKILLENEIGIPVADVISENGKQMIVKIILEYFDG